MQRVGWVSWRSVTHRPDRERAADYAPLIRTTNFIRATLAVTATLRPFQLRDHRGPNGRIQRIEHELRAVAGSARNGPSSDTHRIGNDPLHVCAYDGSQLEVVRHPRLKADVSLASDCIPYSIDGDLVSPWRTVDNKVRTGSEFADQFTVGLDGRRAVAAHDAGMSDEVETALSPVQRLVLRLEGGGLCCAATRQDGQEKKRG
jgi:hypothetical protein